MHSKMWCEGWKGGGVCGCVQEQQRWGRIMTVARGGVSFLRASFNERCLG